MVVTVSIDEMILWWSKQHAKPPPPRRRAEGLAARSAARSSAAALSFWPVSVVAVAKQVSKSRAHRVPLYRLSTSQNTGFATEKHDQRYHDATA